MRLITFIALLCGLWSAGGCIIAERARSDVGGVEPRASMSVSPLLLCTLASLLRGGVRGGIVHGPIRMGDRRIQFLRQSRIVFV